jgi:hypothetical protein
LGETVIGIAWNGTAKNGSVAVNGVYMARFVIQRELTTYEIRNLDELKGSVENILLRVGVKR